MKDIHSGCLTLAEIDCHTLPVNLWAIQALPLPGWRGSSPPHSRSQVLSRWSTGYPHQSSLDCILPPRYWRLIFVQQAFPLPMVVFATPLKLSMIILFRAAGDSMASQKIDSEVQDFTTLAVVFHDAYWTRPSLPQAHAPHASIVLMSYVASLDP